jgi:tetratricopeptide (TPR) repeat protein
MRSSDLGKLFEGATSKILSELFQCWGYETINRKIQSSGTQHGFDVFYKISTQHIRLNIFVECKASNTYNSINSRELTQKIEQLNWAGFPDKDIHLFFSPSRAIKFDNDLLTIENDSHPFVIIDWMRKEGEISPVTELFAAYRDYGTDPEILEYCDLLFTEIDTEFPTPRTFEEVCAQLKHNFDRRIAEHSAKIKYRDYRIINGAFWSQIRQETQFEYIHYYYTKTDSTPARLREVVANDLYVRNETLDKEFERALSQAIKEKAALIKILSKGGEGKSTFLYHISKTHYDENVIIWLEPDRDIGADILVDIERQIHRLNTERPIIFLLDNAAVYGKPLTEFAQKLITGFRGNRIVLVLAEREFRYQNIEDIQEFESVFNETHTINYRSNRIRGQVFDRLISYLQTSGVLSHHGADEAKNVFLEDRRKSLTECAFSVIKYLKATEQLRGYNFDWDDWEEFTKHNAPALQRLYLILSTFYQFGYSLDLDFCASFLKGVDVIDINTVLRDNPNLPIYRRGHHLLLRHETIASWYLDGTTEKTIINRQNSEEIFKAFLKNINTAFSRNIFIWLCIKNRDFRLSYLAQYVDNETRVSILENFIEHNPSELKSRTELSKIYQQQRKWDDAIRLLKEYIELDPDGLHPRTELSKIYQQQKRWKEAEDILLESLKIDSEQLHPRTELSRIYQQQKRWKEAEDILLELMALDPENLQARTELSKIYQQQKRWKEAEDILLEELSIDPDLLRPRTELSKIYQQQKRWKEAEDILLRCLPLNPDDLESRTELSKIYQRQKRWKEAEDILLKSLQIDPENLHARIELSKLYQKQRKIPEAEKLLGECLSIAPDNLNSLLELGKICSKDFTRHDQAEQFFQRILNIEPDNLFAKIELASLYLKMRKYGAREKILFEIYDTHPEDIPTLMALAQVFRRFRKYRIALRLLESALELRGSDLITISELIRLHMILHSSENVRQYLSKGREILKQDPFNKHRERFNSNEIVMDDGIELLNLNEIGLCIHENGQSYVECNGVRYLVDDQTTVNNQLKAGDNAFFATYTRNGQVFIDFVEPYFESIDHLDKLR